MRIRVMCLIVLVYVCVYEDLFGALPFEKILLSVLYYLIVEFKHLQSGFLRPVSCSDGAIHVFYLRLALECWITVCYASLLCIIQHVAAYWGSTPIDRQHVQCSYLCMCSRPLTVHFVGAGYVFCVTLVTELQLLRIVIQALQWQIEQVQFFCNRKDQNDQNQSCNRRHCNSVTCARISLSPIPASFPSLFPLSLPPSLPLSLPPSLTFPYPQMRVLHNDFSRYNVNDDDIDDLGMLVSICTLYMCMYIHVLYTTLLKHSSTLKATSSSWLKLLWSYKT